jgi:hypothetical protein
MKTFGGMEALLQQFITLPLDGNEWSVSCLAILPPQKSPNTQCVGVWVDPRAGQYIVEKKKIPSCWEANPDSQLIQPIA